MGWQVEAAWTSGDSNANGDYGGRNDSQPTAADVDTLDFSTKVAAIGLSESRWVGGGVLQPSYVGGHYTGTTG